MDAIRKVVQEMRTRMSGPPMPNPVYGSELHEWADRIEDALAQQPVRAEDRERVAAALHGMDELASRSDKIDRAKVIGRVADANLSVILDALASPDAQQPANWLAELREGADYWREKCAILQQRLDSAEAQQPAVVMNVAQIGNYGAAYDAPGTRRAFTYDHQPGNVDASRIGNATKIASRSSMGDSIDRGLSLLKALQEEGFGVLQVDSSAALTPASPAAVGDVVERLRKMRRGVSGHWSFEHDAKTLDDAIAALTPAATPGDGGSKP